MTDVGPELAAIEAMDLAALRRAWRRRHGILPPRLSRDLLRRHLAYTLQEDALGGVSNATRRRLQTLTKAGRGASDQGPPVRAGTHLVRAWRGRTYLVTVTDDGFVYDGVTDVLQLSKSGQRMIGRVDRAPSHAATSNSVLMN